jgi:gliding motility-associated-like protein
MLESQYGNNLFNYAYAPEAIQVVPADTVVLRNSIVPLRIASTIYRPASVLWTPDAGASLSCNACLTPVATVREDGLVHVNMQNRYGCTLTGTATLKILPPDLTIRITGTECYSNQATLVNFIICMNNGYNKVYKGLPVRFYAEDPSSGSRKMLEPLFMTTKESTSGCDSFSAIINSPAGNRIYAVVNDQGGAMFPDTAFRETDLTNNIADGPVRRFVVTAVPADTFIYRNTTVQLNGSAAGGELRAYLWSPADALTCVQCLDPVARVPYSREYVFTGKNQYECVSSDTVRINMYTDGPVNIPNAFTPNGDGKNDVFYVLGSRDIERVKQFLVYDRYGQVVFRKTDIPPNDPVFGWKGELPGGDRGNGTFVYSIMVQFKNGREQLYKGTVTVIR